MFHPRNIGRVWNRTEARALMTKTEDSPQIAVWYFVAATFVFASTELFFTDPEPWVRICALVLGFGLVVAGGFQLGKELKARRQKKRP